MYVYMDFSLPIQGTHTHTHTYTQNYRECEKKREREKEIKAESSGYRRIQKVDGHFYIWGEGEEISG